MFKVFLVEDEMIMRRGMKENVPWESNGFDFVGEASDGELAYPMIKKIKPDIVITDIKMPFMDGLELSSIIKRELPDTKIIILSGYSDFDYAKQAISIGVTEYLLKPISSSKLLEAVIKVADLLHMERKQKELLWKYEKETGERLEVERRRLFHNIVNQLLSTGQILKKADELGMDFTASCYNVMMLKLSSGEDSQENIIKYSEQMVKANEQIHFYTENEEQLISIHRESEGWNLIIKADNEKEIQEIERNVHSKIQNITKDYERIGYFIGTGKPVDRLRDLSISYREAGKAFASRFFMGLDQLVSYQDVEHTGTVELVDLNLKMVNTEKLDRKLVNNFLSSGTMEEAEQFVEKVFWEMREEQYKSQIFRQYIAVDMYFSVVNFLEKLGRSADDLNDDFGNAKEMAVQLTSVENLKSYLLSLLCEAIRIRDTETASQYSLLLIKAKEYINQNFHKHKISLNTVASHVNISPSYFSTLFRQEVGQTFIEYVTGLRMEKAKELLMCTGMKATEISFEVGYGDSHYFSYIFKKTQGCTPMEFRMRGRV